MASKPSTFFLGRVRFGNHGCADAPDGRYRLCHEIRKSDRLHKLAILVYTSSFTSLTDERLAMSAGADAFVPKPANAQKILDTLERIMQAPRLERVPTEAAGELEILKVYSAGLVRRLEEKNVDLEAVHESLTRANEELRRSESQVHLLLDSTAEGICGVDMECRITFSNLACAELLGFREPKELLGLYAHRLIHPARKDETVCLKADCGICGPLFDGLARFSSDDRFWRADGTSFPAEYRSRAIRQKGLLIGAVVSFSDISERKRIEEALRKSEERFSRAFHATPVATSIAEAETSRMIDVNGQFLEILGYAREEVIGRTSAKLGLWADPAARTRVVEDLARDTGVRDRKGRLRTKTGEIREVIGSIVRIELGNLPCILSTFVDVTDRERAEKALRGSEQWNRALMEHAKDAIIVWSLDGKVIDVNGAAQELVGRPRAEMVGRSLLETRAPGGTGCGGTYVREHDRGSERPGVCHVDSSGGRESASRRDIGFESRDRGHDGGAHQRSRHLRPPPGSAGSAHLGGALPSSVRREPPAVVGLRRRDPRLSRRQRRGMPPLRVHPR